MSWEDLRTVAKVIRTKFHSTKCAKCGGAIERDDWCLWIPPDVLAGKLFTGGKRRCLHLTDAGCNSSDRVHTTA